MLLYLCTNNVGHIYPHARREFFLLIHHLKNELWPVIIYKAQQVLYSYFLENLRF